MEEGYDTCQGEDGGGGGGVIGEGGVQRMEGEEPGRGDGGEAFDGDAFARVDNEYVAEVSV